MSEENSINQTSSQKSIVKKVIKIVCILLVIFCLLNILWYCWRANKYGVYSEGMSETEFSSFVVPKYLDSSDGYNYSVKYPDYLSFTGNLALSVPSEDDNPFTDSLIIWPNVDGSYEYGIILYEGEDEWQIYVDENGQALDPQYDEVIENHQENVDLLFEKANERWDLD